mmetsp:Transcript_790/g.959  ORF Transcript_790/g.959 Transcript_790/m.959 type:complete len:209 (-) Transcript_790:8-634(-)
MSVSPKQQAKLDKLTEKLDTLSKSVISDNPDVEDIDALLGKMFGCIKPSSLSPIDTCSEEAFSAAMMEASVAALHVNLIGIGDELGYFSALLDKPMSYDDLSNAVNCDCQYTKEWCIVMTAGKVLDYNEEDDTFSVTATVQESVRVSMNPSGLVWGTILPVCIGDRRKLIEAFKTGRGIDWNDRDPQLYNSTCSFFKPLYENHLVSSQ